jgi:hypothetical protein
MGDLLDLLAAGKDYGVGLKGGALLIAFWVVSRLASTAGRRAVSYVGQILKMSEEVREALRDELELARETINEQRVYIEKLEKRIKQLEAAVV